MRLVDSKTGKELQVGDAITTFRGESDTLKRIWQPGTSQGGNGGRVELENGMCPYFPGVINAQFVV